MAKVIKVQEVQFCFQCNKDMVFEGDTGFTNAVGDAFVFCVGCSIASVLNAEEYL